MQICALLNSMAKCDILQKALLVRFGLKYIQTLVLLKNVCYNMEKAVGVLLFYLQ